MSNNIFDDFDEQSQDAFQGLKFLSFEDVQNGIIGRDPFEGVRTNKGFDEISNEIALTTLFKKNSVFYKPIYVKDNIDFPKLVQLILNNKDVLFNWKDYIAHKTETIKHRVVSGGEDAKFDRMMGLDTTYMTTEVVETESPLKENTLVGERILDLQGKLNKELNIVNIKEDNNRDITSGLEFEFDYKNRIAIYKLHFYYINKARVTEAQAENKNNIAFTISTKNYQDFVALFKLCNLKYTSSRFEDKIAKAFKDAINTISKLENKQSNGTITKLNDYKFNTLDWLYANIPAFVAKQLDFNQTIANVFDLSGWDKSFYLGNDTTQSITTILSRLKPEVVYSYFNKNPQYILDLLQGFDDDAAVERFCQYLTAVTLMFKGEKALDNARKFSVGENTHIESNMLFGDPNGQVQLVNEMQLPAIPSVNYMSSKAISLFTPDLEINNPNKQSNLFHPLDLIYLSYYDANLDEQIKIPTIALYAKYLGDKGEWADVLTATFAVIDVISIIFSGGAFVAGIKGIARVFAILDIAISTANLALLSPEVKNALNKTEAGKWFVAHWPLISFCVSAGMISVYLAKGILKYGSQVKNQLKNSDDIVKNIDELIEESKRVVDEVSSSNIQGKGLYSGKRLTKTDIETWAKFLKKQFGTKLKMIDAFDNPQTLAQFDPNTNTIKYKEDVTEYFMAHESFHAEEMKKIGFKEYTKNAHIKETPWTIENRIHQYKREKYVYERLVEENGKTYNFNAEEISKPPFGHAFQYYDLIKAELEVLLKNNNIPFPN